MDIDTGKIIAIKKVPILNFIKKDQKDIRLIALEKEIRLLSSFKHPNIVKYLGNQNTGESLNIFLEYVSSGSISSLISKYGKFNETLVRIYTKHILTGLDYLHAHNVIHGDIKGSNVLVDDDGVCKLADFGGSNRIMKHSDKRQRMVGTAQWMAPEVIRESKYNRFSDIWSVGCVVIEMLQGCPPWSECENAYAALFKIAKTRQPPAFPEDISYEARDFLQRCLNVDPKRRPNVRTLLTHPFITNEKIGPKFMNEFYGVGAISDNFKNFYNQFIDNEDDLKSLIGKRPKQSPFDNENSEACHSEGANEITRVQDQSIPLAMRVSQFNSTRFGRSPLHEEEIKQEENPFSTSRLTLTLEELAPVKVIKGGKLQSKKTERFSIMNLQPTFDRTRVPNVINFKNNLNEEEEFIVRCKTEKPNFYKKKMLDEMDKLLLDKSGRVYGGYGLENHDFTHEYLRTEQQANQDTKSDSPYKSPDSLKKARTVNLEKQKSNKTHKPERPSKPFEYKLLAKPESPKVKRTFLSPSNRQNISSPRVIEYSKTQKAGQEFVKKLEGESSRLSEPKCDYHPISNGSD